MLIKEIFNFKSEINCDIQICCLEELLLTEFQKLDINKVSPYKRSRLKVLKELTFDAFNKRRIFDHERTVLKEIIIKNCNYYYKLF